MKYDFASSTPVDVRSVSPRTLLATASPIAESAAVSQSTVSRADPRRRSLGGVCIAAPWCPVDVQHRGDCGNVQLGGCGIERRHVDSNAPGQLPEVDPIRSPNPQGRFLE